MKKFFLCILTVLFIQAVNAQIYMHPVIHYETSPGACDGYVDMVVYGATPPYAVEWYGAFSNGLHAQQMCDEPFVRASLIDNNCFGFEAAFSMVPYGSYPPMFVDTIIMIFPSIANNDGIIEVHIGNVPPGYTRVWATPSGGGVTTDSVFTGLSKGGYIYSIYDQNSSLAFEISIPFRTGVNTPCDPFNVDVSVNSVTGEYIIPGDCITNPDSIPDSSTIYNGSLLVMPSGGTSGIYTAVVSPLSFGPLPSNPDSSGIAGGLSRGPYEISVITDFFSNQNNINSYDTRFVRDSLDIYYSWNIPDTIPLNTDTITLNALDVPAVNYYLVPDTAYIDFIETLGGGQYEITVAVQQPTDTFYFYYIEYLDTNINYVFDLTTYEQDSLLCNVPDMMRNIIYWSFDEVTDTTNTDTCYTGNGNGHHHHGNGHGYGHGNGHNHNGPCNEEELRASWVDGKAATSIAANGLKVYPNPFTNELEVKSKAALRKIDIYSVDGKLEKSVVTNAVTCLINVNDLEPATYIVKTIDINGKSEFARVIKMN